MLGEAKFWRAYNYFWMVKFFGAVPIVTEPYESLDNINVPRNPVEDVYTMIITDLEWALDKAGFPDVPYYLNGFKVTKGLVATLLADVYLQQAGYPIQSTTSYQKAANAARIVINSGVYQLIKHVTLPTQSAYNVMRVTEKTLEYIYSIEYEPNLKATPKPQYTIPSYARPPGTRYQDMWNCYHPRDEFSRIYDPVKDLRIQNRQLWHNSIERGGIKYDFNAWAPYLWYDEDAIFNSGKGGQDFPILRYAKVLLIAAEAIAQVEGVTNEAVSYLADVRSRAYWQSDENQIKAELQALSKQQFIEEVWKERHRELVFDFATWPDIQRTRKYPVTSASNPGIVTFVDLVGATNPFGATFQEFHLIWPIPLMVMQKNPAMEQNPGY
ncbi:MAG: hypothetical protein A2X05_02175 [Bacteroidetes bacterium GWE2_41_25]|nr:MAG: hypothetical protein A2X05_02175 [Bacteroidetes bacterium GWE2_41_25]HBH85890.1 RagB/SusD family nutrient uptake outer membrane protein [Bacteroidales bacterium]